MRRRWGRCSPRCCPCGRALSSSPAATATWRPSSGASCLPIRRCPPCCAARRLLLIGHHLRPFRGSENPRRPPTRLARPLLRLLGSRRGRRRGARERKPLHRCSLRSDPHRWCRHKGRRGGGPLLRFLRLFALPEPARAGKAAGLSCRSEGMHRTAVQDESSNFLSPWHHRIFPFERRALFPFDAMGPGQGGQSGGKGGGKSAARASSP